MKNLSKALLFAFLVILLGLLATMLGLWVLPHTTDAHRIHDFLQHYRWAFALWRYSMLALAIWQWPALCRFYGKRQSLSDEAISHLIKRRWWFLGFVVIFEVVVVYGV